MKTDKEFYDLWEEEDKPIDDQKIALEASRIKSKRYNLDNRIYIVRGYDVFVVHSDDIDVGKPTDGKRTIIAKDARMIKYTEDGRRITD